MTSLLWVLAVCLLTESVNSNPTEGLGSETGNECTLCGKKPNPNNNVIELEEPRVPGPFHDLTRSELKRVRKFLKNHPDFKDCLPGNSFNITKCHVYAVDYFHDEKSVIISDLDQDTALAIRKARIAVLHSDRNPPVVSEYLLYPLHDIETIEILSRQGVPRTTPFSMRPFTPMDYIGIYTRFTAEINFQLQDLLMDSYGVDSYQAFKLIPQPLSSLYTKSPGQRLIWVLAAHNVPFSFQHLVNLDLLVDFASPNSNYWRILKVVYAGNVYESLYHLNVSYYQKIPKEKIFKPSQTQDSFSKADTVEANSVGSSQRPPVEVEPDSKRYSIRQDKVEYLGWSFYFRMSSFTGPVIYDVRFDGTKMAFEIALSEIATIYSGDKSWQTAHYIVNSFLLGMMAKNIIPGADCPDHATVISKNFFNQLSDDDTHLDGAFCLFETNSGIPLRRKSFYTDPSTGGFYSGMLDSSLVLRSIIIIGSSDYVFDFIFHQDGTFESRIMATGALQVTSFSANDKKYGFRLNERMAGALHHHLFHFKVDLDVEGVNNYFYTTELIQELVEADYDECIQSYVPTLKITNKTNENNAVYDFDINEPKFLFVSKETPSLSAKAYRIKLDTNYHQPTNPASIPWARHQLYATKRLDDEISSSSIYAMFDGHNPTVDFSRFVNNEAILNKDLVFWITGSIYDLPHSEDLQQVSTPGYHMNFYLMPHNVFPKCPTSYSRDAINVYQKTDSQGKTFVNLDRAGNVNDTCLTPKPSLECYMKEKPDFVIKIKQ